jgi:gas vesicle protein GvpL/GvpF
VIELVAITDAAGAPPERPPLRLVESGRLAVVCAPAEERELTPEALWERERLVEALMEERDLLPVRYGTRVLDEQEAARTLGEREAELSEALDRVRGAVELSVRVIGDRPPPATGTEFIRGRAEVAALHERLSLVARDSARRPARAAGELMRAAYLVDRGAVDEFVSLVERLQAESDDSVRLLCTGPWPPYSFTSV